MRVSCTAHLVSALETHSVVRVFTSRDTDSVRLEALADSSVSKSIIRCRWFLNEPRLDRLKELDIINCLFDVPNLCFVSVAWRINARLASIMSTQPVGPAFLPLIDSGSIGLRSLGMLAGLSMMLRINCPRRRSSAGSAPTLSCQPSALRKPYEEVTHLEVVESLVKTTLNQFGNFLIRVT